MKRNFRAIPRKPPAVQRARGLGAQAVQGPLFNPAPRHRELWLRDPDGYVVVISSPDGERDS